MSKPRLPRITGVIHSSRNASPHNTYCAVPPAAPPATTSNAELTFHGVNLTIARTTLAADDRMKRVEWTSTTTRYASPKASPLPENAFGIASASTK